MSAINLGILLAGIIMSHELLNPRLLMAASAKRAVARGRSPSSKTRSSSRSSSSSGGPSSPSRKSSESAPKRNKITISKITENRKKFPINFPITAGTCSSLAQRGHAQDTIEEIINSAYPVISEEALNIIQKYLDSRAHSSFYAKMSLKKLLNRLIRKRAVAFYDSSDAYTVIVKKKDGYEVKTGRGGWENVGTACESYPLTFKNALTYDEIRLAALITFSSRTIFLNDGNRKNRGVYDDKRDTIEDSGVIIGVVGSRLEKEHFMEHRDTFIMPGERHENVVDRLFSKYFQSMGCTGSSEKISLGEGNLFDACVFRVRTKMILKTLLIDANSRAQNAKKKAFIHVVGFGLGVWQRNDQQPNIFTLALIETLGELADNLPHVAVVRMAWIGNTKYLECTHVKHVRIVFEDRNPHEKVASEYLLVATYAYDGNAVAGNEFWHESLSASGDPAAACSTQIAEIQNPYINPRMSAEYLMVANSDGRLRSFNSL